VRPVIEDGVLSTFFIDTYYANKLGCDPTTGGPSNLEMKLGEKDLAALIADAGSGVYVTNWAGGNADLTNGDFSYGLQGHVIENGQIGGPIGEMNVTGNYSDLLASLVAVGNDPFPYASFLTPTLVFENAQLSGA
jgi:PmbA protein